jgi:hypothetical protein
MEKTYHATAKNQEAVFTHHAPGRGDTKPRGGSPADNMFRRRRASASGTPGNHLFLLPCTPSMLSG